MKFESNMLADFENTIKEKRIICFQRYELLEELFDYLDIYDKVECFITTENCDNNTVFAVGKYKYNVYPLEFLNQCSPNEFVILVTGNDVNNGIRFLNRKSNINNGFRIYHKYFLEENGNFFYKYRLKSYNYDCCKRVISEGNDIEAFLKFDSFEQAAANELKSLNGNKVILPQVLFDITTRCTLSCKDCLALTNRYNKHRDTDINSLIEDMDLFFNAVDKVYITELIGGEPFLYPYIDTALKYLIDCKKVSAVHIVTNGTVKPRESTLRLLSDYKVFVSISIYEKSLYVKDLIKLFKNNFVKFGCTDFTKDMYWVSMDNINKRKISTQQLKEEYIACQEACLCKTVMNGRLYPCHIGARLYDLNIVRDKNDYIELKNNKNLSQEIYSFYQSSFCEACRYCGFSDVNKKIVKAGVQG